MHKVRVLQVLSEVCPEKAENYSVDHPLGVCRVWQDVEIEVVWFLECLCGYAVIFDCDCYVKEVDSCHAGDD